MRSISRGISFLEVCHMSNHELEVSCSSVSVVCGTPFVRGGPLQPTPKFFEFESKKTHMALGSVAHALLVAVAAPRCFYILSLISG